MFEPIDWNRTGEYVLVAAYYLVSLMGTFAAMSELLLPDPAALSEVFLGFFLTSTVASGWYLLKRFGDGIFIGER